MGRESVVGWGGGKSAVPADVNVPQLVACDVDGTLLTSAHELTEATVAAVRGAVGAGVRFVLVTSRPPVAIRSLLVRLGLVGPGDGAAHPFVASQGALVGGYTTVGALVVHRQRAMPVDAARVVVAELPAELEVNWYAGGRWLVGGLGPLVEEEAAIVGCRPEVTSLAAQESGPDKLLVLAPPARTELLDRVAVPAGLAAVRSTPTHLEITADGVDKGAALLGLCAELGIDPGRTAAIGDGANDLAMLRAVGLPVAMGNAVAEVRAAARLVTSANDDDGVARAVAMLLGG